MASRWDLALVLVDLATVFDLDNIHGDDVVVHLIDHSPVVGSRDTVRMLPSGQFLDAIRRGCCARPLMTASPCSLVLPTSDDGFAA